MAKTEQSLYTWGLRAAQTLVNKVRITRHADGDAYSESIESYVCGPLEIIPEASLVTGPVMVSNTKFVDYRVNSIRFYCEVMDTSANKSIGTFQVYCQKLHILERSDNAAIPIIFVHHVVTRAMDKDNKTVIIKRCPICQYINMDTGEICMQDGYPLPKK